MCACSLHAATGCQRKKKMLPCIKSFVRTWRAPSEFVLKSISFIASSNLRRPNAEWAVSRLVTFVTAVLTFGNFSTLKDRRLRCHTRGNSGRRVLFSETMLSANASVLYALRRIRACALRRTGCDVVCEHKHTTFLKTDATWRR